MTCCGIVIQVACCNFVQKHNLIKSLFKKKNLWSGEGNFCMNTQDFKNLLFFPPSSYKKVIT